MCICYWISFHKIISISAFVVISSTGGTALHNGGVLGQFEYNWAKGCYVQSSTGQLQLQDFMPVYLYPDEDDMWYVSNKIGDTQAWLFNPRPNKTVPASGWWYTDGESLQEDLTLTVTAGPLPPLPKQFMVTATGATADIWPSYLGVFTRTEMWWLGRPVYFNTKGRLLFHGHNDYGWLLSPDFGSTAIRGSRAYPSPVIEDNWSYSSGGRWKPATVTVTPWPLKISEKSSAANRLEFLVINVILAWFVTRII